jgi:hypothetical protein
MKPEEEASGERLYRPYQAGARYLAQSGNPGILWLINIYLTT